MVDSLFADVSYFQRPVDDSYPHNLFSFRSNDGTFQDEKFAANWDWSVAHAGSQLSCFHVYCYWRANWEQTGDTLISMVQARGGPHPLMVPMIDVESGGNPGGDQSDGINRLYWMLTDWLGTSEHTGARRVIGYANSPDFATMWRTRPDGLRVIGAGYGHNPQLPGQIAHQYTNGGGYGGGLPEGASPFGNCDMNSADGLSPQEYAAACGIGPAMPTDPNVPIYPTTDAALLGAAAQWNRGWSENDTEPAYGEGPDARNWGAARLAHANKQLNQVNDRLAALFSHFGIADPVSPTPGAPGSSARPGEHRK